jgi:hypothetical protein
MVGLRNILFDNPEGKANLKINNPQISLSLNQLLKTLVEVYEVEIRTPTERVDPPLETIKDEDEEDNENNEIFIKVGYKPFLEVINESIDQLIKTLVLFESGMEKIDEESEEGKKCYVLRRTSFQTLIKGLKEFSKQRKKGKGISKVLYLFFFLKCFIYLEIKCSCSTRSHRKRCKCCNESTTYRGNATS